MAWRVWRFGARLTLSLSQDLRPAVTDMQGDWSDLQGCANGLPGGHCHHSAGGSHLGALQHMPGAAHGRKGSSGREP